MITILKTPPEIILTGNPATIQVLGSDENGDAFFWHGVRSILSTQETTGIPRNEYITLNWREPSGLKLAVSFVAKTIPSRDDQISSDYSAFPSLLAYWQAVAEKIQEHPNVSPALKVYAMQDGNTYFLYAVARDMDTLWQVDWNTINLTIPHTTENLTNPVTNHPTGYRTRVDILLEENYMSEDFRIVGRTAASPDGESRVEYHIHQILAEAQERLVEDPAIPAWGSNMPEIAGLLRRYRYRTFEQTPDQSNDYADFETSDEFLSLHAGISQHIMLTRDFFSNIDDKNSILTWRPDRRIIDAAQPEWISWINYTGSIKQVMLRVTKYDQDGNPYPPQFFAFSGGTDQPAQPLEVRPWQVIHLPVGYTQLGLTDSLWKYSVQVIDYDEYQAGNKIFLSPSRSYYLSRYPRRTVRYLMYLNGFNCPETLRCIGDFDENSKVERTTSRRVLSSSARGHTPERLSRTTAWEKIWTYRTGYLPEAEMQALHEIHLTRHLYEVDQHGYIPLTLFSRSFPGISTRKNLRSMELIASPALLERKYSSPLPRIDSPDGIPWEENDGSWWVDSYGTPWETP